MKSIYVPANGQQFENYWKNHPELEFNGYDIKYFTEKSAFQHDHALVNAYYNIDIENVRKTYGYPSNLKLLVDSGGFQIASFTRKGKPISIQPIDILRWIEKNADIGMNLDEPVVNDFDTSLKRSLENFQIFQNSRENYNFKLYNILHGHNLTQIKNWYNAVKEFDFDGWAIGIKPSSNVFLQTLGYMVLHENNAKNLLNNIHFFGMSSIQNMLALAMLSHHFNTKITFDSSTFNMGSRTRMYYLPMSARYFLLFGRNKQKLMKTLPCNCPYCRNTNIDFMYSQDNQLVPIIISLHNLYQFVEVNKTINALVDDYDALLKYARSLNETKTVITMQNFLNDYNQHGYQKTYNDYKKSGIFIENFEQEKKKAETQKNINSYFPSKTENVYQML
ncbi:MAG: hypothetical protein WC319_08335 [Candidatus Paceibacterota bacterium]